MTFVSITKDCPLICNLRGLINQQINNQIYKKKFMYDLFTYKLLLSKKQNINVKF